MELSQIEAFLAVVREGSFTEAAHRLNLTQPSLSARIQQLERYLGGQLFLRNKRPIQLTTLGKIFLDYAERAVGILEAGYTAVQAAKTGKIGRVTVTCPFSLATYLLPEVVRRFTSEYPQADLLIEAGHSEFAVNQLLDGVVDLALAAAFPRFLAQAHTLLRLHDEMVVATSPLHPLAHAKGIPVQRLWDFQILIIHWGAAFDAYIESLRQMSGGGMHSVVRVPLAAALPMARQPNTVTFVPRRLTAVSGLVPLDVPDFHFPWDAVLLTRHGRLLTPLEQAFVDTVSAVWYSHQPA
ncbi:MAG: LysR family transcriptional regulator [Chloroflexi bacterium]|nr:MAG: LysR family transcriptional regulator [Chloroflexota bacterium]